MVDYKVFLKGLAMGVADIIPGVSGGTLALILGIYERFISALKNINGLFIIDYFKYIQTKKKKYFLESKKNFLRMDPAFLLVLASGIFISLLAGSYFMPYLMKNFPSFTFSFFFGLIFASAIKLLLKNVKQFKLGNFISLIIGFFIGFSITGLSSILSSHSSVVIFLSGVLAISAMLLPGISGSFVLLILGQYDYILSLVHNLSTGFFKLVLFLIGIFTGLVGFSRVVTFLFKRYPNRTLFSLIGLMLGSLRLIIMKILETAFIPGVFFVIFFSVLLGVIAVVLLE
ncbi:DUF368 domain-containing protein [Candidatus Woesearchaeota archaeon]|nr:DUF368 domain-containing protein [Candidatus Woesearchaeota archaeon]